MYKPAAKVVAKTPAAVKPPPANELNRVRSSSGSGTPHHFSDLFPHTKVVSSLTVVAPTHAPLPRPSPNPPRTSRGHYQELDVLLATEDNTVREEASALLAQTATRVASERLTRQSPSGAELYEAVEYLDGFAVRLSAVDPLRALLSTPKLPAELLEALPEL
jgi:hypothetical protein